MLISSSSKESARADVNRSKLTRANVAAREPSPEHTTDSYAQSSLRGACKIRLKILESRLKELSARSKTRQASCAKSPAVPSHMLSNGQQRCMDSSHRSTHPTLSGAVERQQCFSEDPPTQRSNYSDVGPLMPTRHTSASKQAPTKSWPQK